MNLNDVQYVCTNKKRRKDFKVTTLHNGLSANASSPKRSTSSGPTRKSHTSVSNTSRATSASNFEGVGVILAITEGRGEASCEVGLSAMNIDHPELYLFQISDTSSYRKVLSKVMLLQPREIIVPATFTENRLVDALIRQFPGCKILAIDRSAFRKDAGLLYVKNVCSPDFSSIFLVLLYKYYALAATGALHIYLEAYKRIQIAKETLKVNYGESDYNMMIDVFVADKLELVACAIENTTAYRKRQSSLRGILNHCMTKLGSRLLRSTILQPPNKQEEINNRLDCVEELVKCPEKLVGIRESLKKLVNFGQVLTLATLMKTNAQLNDERQMNYVLILNNFFEEIEPLKEILATCKSVIIKDVYESLHNECFRSLHTLFKDIIHEDARPAYGERANVAKCFAVRNGKSVILDMLRKKYSDRIEDIRAHVNDLSDQMGQDLKLGNNVKKGYHIVMPITSSQRRVFKKSSLPPFVCQVDVMATMVTMKTITLITLSNRLEDTSMEIIRICNEFIQDLLVQVQKNIGYFYEMCEQLAKLDLLQSFAYASTSMAEYVRPSFDDFTRIINGRHPMLDYLLENRPTPNDVLITSDHRMHILTGPNGSGKSIYIRQIVLLQVMAQIGCYVPATCATFRICDQILARINFEDKMECAVSTFALEMNDVKHFLNVSNDRTLIIIDELCRSTSVCEGTTLAMAICEDLLNTGAAVFFTTHYTYITKLQQIYPNILCWQLETNVISGPNAKPQLQFTRKVMPGVVTLDGYGVALARTIWPNDVMNDVDKLLPLVRDKALDTAISKPMALKINLENELRDLKLKGKCFENVAVKRYSRYLEEIKGFGIYGHPEPINMVETVYSLPTTDESHRISQQNNLKLSVDQNNEISSTKASSSPEIQNRDMEAENCKIFKEKVTILENQIIKLPNNNSISTSGITATSFMQEQQENLLRIQHNGDVVVDSTYVSGNDEDWEEDLEVELNFTYNSINNSACHEFLKKCDEADSRENSFLNCDNASIFQDDTVPASESDKKLSLKKRKLNDSCSTTDNIPLTLPSWKSNGCSQSTIKSQQLPEVVDSFFKFKDNKFAKPQEIKTTTPWKTIEDKNVSIASITSSCFNGALGVGKTSTPLMHSLEENNSQVFDFGQPGPSKLDHEIHKSKPLNLLSKKEIEIGYRNRRHAVMQRNNVMEMEAYCEEVFNRPSMRQIRGAEVVISAKKGSNGEIFLDAPIKKKMPVAKRKRFSPPFKFDATIFSDRNLGVFDKFLMDKKATTSL